MKTANTTAILILFLFACGTGHERDQAIALEDQGVALMGRYQYSEAVEAFSAAKLQAP